MVPQTGLPDNTLAKVSPFIKPAVLIVPLMTPGLLPYTSVVGVAVYMSWSPVTWNAPTAFVPDVSTKLGLLNPVTVTK